MTVNDAKEVKKVTYPFPGAWQPVWHAHNGNIWSMEKYQAAQIMIILITICTSATAWYDNDDDDDRDTSLTNSIAATTISTIFNVNTNTFEL